MATIAAHESRIARDHWLDQAGEPGRGRLDNQSYATTGGQDTATAHGADLAAAGHAMGIRTSVTVRTGTELTTALARAASEDGPWVIVAKVDESAPTLKPPLDCVFIKNRFMASQT